jgi:hypothetical protein
MDGRPLGGVAALRSVTDEEEIERPLEMTVEVVRRDESFQETTTGITSSPRSNTREE